MTTELREASFLVLAGLADGPAHGYALLGRVTALSDGRVRLRPGTLYAVLDRLRTEQFVAVTAEEIVGGRLRRTYALTEAGAAALEVQADRMRANAEQAHRALRGLRLRAANQ